MHRISIFLIFCLLLCSIISTTSAYPVGDLDQNWQVNLEDLRFFVDQWMSLPDCLGAPGCADLIGNDRVDFVDFALLAENWQIGETPPLVINEVMASNDTTIADEYGEYDDWFELYNYGAETIEIGGMYFKDSTNSWQIPSGISINAGQYLIFWADDPVEFQGDYHLDFKLSADDDEIGIYLTNDDTSVIDSISFGPQLTDKSYGRYPDATNDWYTMDEEYTSPGSTNQAGMAPEVYFSRLGGVFFYNFDLELVTVSATASIRYTTDGSLPTASSNLYTGPITINNLQARRIRARAYDSPLAPGPISSHSYLALDADMDGFETNLPIVVIDSFNVTIDVSGCIDRTYPDQPVAAMFIDVDDHTGVAKITDVPQYAGRAGMHVRGRTSSCWPKKQFKLELWTETDFEDKKASLLGLPSESDWMLYAPYHDKTLIRNVLTYNWSNDMGLYALRSRPVELFFTETGGKITLDNLNGGNTDYRGIYMLMERIKIDDDRVDIASLETVDNAEPEVSGGYLLKVDKFEAGDEGKGEPGSVSSGHFDTSLNLLGLAIQYDDPSFYVVTGAQQNWIRDWIDEFETVLTSTSFDDPVNGYAKYADVESFVEYDILCELFKSLDGYKYSVYMNKDRNGKMAMGPIFDFNYSAGNTFPLNGTDCYVSDPVMAQRGGWYKQLNASWAAGWLNKMAGDPEFMLACADKWFAHRKDALSDAKIDADIEYLGALLNANGAATRNFTRWNVLNTGLWCNPYYGTVSVPHTHEMEIQWLKNWFTGNGTEDPNEPAYDPDYTDRLEWIDSHWGPERDIPAPPTLLINSSPMDTGGSVAVGSSLTMSAATAGTIYYTDDGTDPRTWTQPPTGGGVSPFTRTLVTEDAAKAVLVPGAAVNENWKGGGAFDDSSWNDYTYVSGKPGGVGYEAGSGYEAYLSYDTIGTMYNIHPTCYIRTSFSTDAADLPDMDYMTLRVRYDDAFVAYINGTEVARSSLAPASPAWDSQATTYLPSDTIAFTAYNITADLGLLNSGSGNILAIHGLNSSNGSSDMLISYELEAGSGGGSPIPGGDISASAAAYSGAITLNATKQIRARIKDDTNWSALNKANFSIGPVAGNLRITELMYHPIDPNDEFIELKNIGASSINLAWCEFTDGVEFTFPDSTLAAGDHALVVRKQSEFVKHYPSVAAKVVGEYTGYALSNGGEEIVLRDAAGTEIHDFDYNDWYPVTDGYNFSLCIIDPASTDPNDWDEKEGWQASSANGGSPGAANPANVVANGSIVINEVLTHTDDPDGDWIELHNTTGVAIDVGGWFLSDDFDNLKRYEIASGTLVPANGYKVFTSVANFRNAGDPGSHVQFGLSELGEDVFLSSGSGAYGGDPNGGYSITENFGAAENDVTFGRYVKSAASGYNVDFVSMVSATKENLNSAAKVESVVINEIMYNSSAVQDQLGEFIELKNRSGSTAQLYDPVNPSNTWMFTKGIDFTFPTGITMTAGERILIVRTAPEIFRSNHSLSPLIQILGPFENYTELQNSGEKIELSMPGTPEPGGFVPYIRAEQVNYSDGSHPPVTDPWPTSADGDGDSLNRINASQYSNDVANWQSSSPSPGLAN